MGVKEKLVKQAISHFSYGVSHDIFSEPVTTYAKLAIEALEKQIPKKVVKGKDLFWEYQCPNTNCDTQFARHASYEFCPGCGQAIDWSEYK